MIRLGICGIGGRMGSAVRELALLDPEFEIEVGIDREALSDDHAAELGVARVVAMADAVPALEHVDVLIDFSSADATHSLLDHAADALTGRAVVVGTTGLDEHTRHELDELAARAAVLVASNFSPGVNLLLALSERLAAALSPDEYDVEIVEAHHRRKADAPSGTALSLAEAVARGRDIELGRVRCDGRTGETGERPPGEIGIHALRGGTIVGEHTVRFIGERERIEIRHEATDRTLFAAGALSAARWISGRPPGHYTMRDVLNL